MLRLFIPSSLQPIGHWSFYYVHSFTFSRSLCGWYHTRSSGPQTSESITFVPSLPVFSPHRLREGRNLGWYVVTEGVFLLQEQKSGPTFRCWTLTDKEIFSRIWGAQSSFSLCWRLKFLTGDNWESSTGYLISEHRRMQGRGLHCCPHWAFRQLMTYWAFVSRTDYITCEVSLTPFLDLPLSASSQALLSWRFCLLAWRWCLVTP